MNRDVEAFLDAKKAVNADGETISFDCQVESARTDWEKKELKISLATKKEDAEYDAARLGEIARLEHPISFMVYQVNGSMDQAIEANATLDGVKLDYKTEKISISLTVEKLIDEMVPKANYLGYLAHMELQCTVRFQAAQRRLL